MSLIDDLKGAQVTALRAKDSFRRGLIGSVLADADNTVKKEKTAREMNDADVLAAIRRFLKSAKETREILVQADRDTSQPDAEMAILESFLPKQMSEDEIRAAAENIITEQGLDRNIKSMGKIIKELMTRYEGQFENAVASSIVKSLVS